MQQPFQLKSSICGYDVIKPNHKFNWILFTTIFNICVNAKNWKGEKMQEVTL